MIHEECSSTNRITLNQSFHSCKREETDTVVSFIVKVQNLARQLRYINYPVIDETVVGKILAGLPSKYGAFLTAWESMDPSRQIITVLQERLIKEEKRLASEEAGVVHAFSSVSINSHRTRQANRHRQGERRGQRLSKCEGECSSSRQDRCFHCVLKGHIARNCRKRNKHKSKHPDYKYNRQGHTQQSSCRALRPTPPAKQSDNHWTLISETPGLPTAEPPAT